MELKRNDSGRDEDGARYVDQGRRHAMRKIAVGMGVLATYSILPEQWTRPIIGQVVLPAHAATSGSTLNDPCSVVLTAGNQSTVSVTINVTGFVTPPTANVPIAIAAVAAGGGNASTNVVTNAKGKLPPNVSQDGMVAAALNQGGEIVDMD